MKNSILLLMALLVTLAGCETYDDKHVPADLAVKDFIWKGMNLYYLWQPHVPDLSDERFENQNQLNQYLSVQPGPVPFFNDLKIDPPIDRFSVIYSDYTVLEGVLSGNTKNNGVDFGLRFVPGSTTQIYGWVRYIIPGSDASQKEIFRGDIFYAVDGQPLTVSNYQSLLSADNYTLNLADLVAGQIVPNGRLVQLTKTALAENPVLISDVITAGGRKIAYLMYNGFYQNAEPQLNQAFGQFKAQGAQDLVLDLRYNSGGSIATATRLASMITGQFTGQVFATEQWNPKVMDFLQSQGNTGLTNFFTSTLQNGSPIQSLNLNRVYVLTTRSTASASELIINCLRPYIQVIQIGDSTVGKNVGSITLYDSVNFRKEGANPAHKYAMQPIVLRVVNKNGFGEYDTGLAANVQQPEDLGNLGTLGQPDEPLLQTAIAQITGQGRLFHKFVTPAGAPFSDSKSLDGLRNQMVGEIPQLK